VTHGKAWIEMAHRYSASAIGVLVIALAVLAIVERAGSGSMPRRSGQWRRSSGFSARARSAR
jgi:cytochrome c oxidase assembly protein subunit 15